MRLTYAQAVDAVLGAPPDAPTAELARRLAKQGVDVPAGLAHDAVLDLAFGTVVLASFDASAVTFVYDYPASQAALARVKADDAARRGAVRGVLRRHRARERFSRAHRCRRAAPPVRRATSRRAAPRGRHAPPLDEQLLRALPSLPDCAGVALGFDRLVALATGQDNVAAARRASRTARRTS